MIEVKTIEQVNKFNYLDCSVGYLLGYVHFTLSPSKFSNVLTMERRKYERQVTNKLEAHIDTFSQLQ